ncbi:hypothetical protein IV203_007180 [Nitzschia inconspicua]|uniref:Uncharacterized protein n=1 Tax=Nitzschia inconspicua TaxID=303405 RepID=A0A9K3PC58_9STRA|nr:hypothetical protein IV203_007180 [Nitzschia inconspicua]
MIRRFGWKRVTISLILAVLTVLSFFVPWNSTSLSTSSLRFVDIEASTGVSLLLPPPNVTIYNVIGPDKNRHCARPCHPAIRNRLVYTCLHPAGLLDRQELMDNLLELASFLCATLEFPTPSQSFHPMHNHQRTVDQSLDWSDFFEYSLVQMDESHKPQREEFSANQANPSLSLVKTVKVVMDPSFYLPWNKKPHCRRPRAAPDRNRTTYGLHILSKSREEVLNDFDTVRRFSFSESNTEKPFLWEMPTNFYSFHKELRAHLRAIPPKRTDLGAACIPWSRSGHYARRAFPPLIESLISDIWDAVMKKTTSGINGNVEPVTTPTKSNLSSTPKHQPILGFLHVRRGDTIEECDTSITKLRSYLSCSFSNMTFPKILTASSEWADNPGEKSVLSVTLLIGTNDEDPIYIQELQSMVRELSLSATFDGRTVDLQIEAIDMESLIWDHLQSEVQSGRLSSAYLNNLHVFQILEHIMNRLVNFKLVQRRFRYCNDCDPIVIRSARLPE